MGANKKRHMAGERSYLIPGFGNTYRMSDDKGWYHLGQGPRPHYRPTPDESKAGIPDDFPAEARPAGATPLSEEPAVPDPLQRSSGNDPEDVSGARPTERTGPYGPERRGVCGPARKPLPDQLNLF